ncbi:hypothetical protein DRN97_06515 [Methanosarcinales archaeon]|nr:MAG: hypothetical protein DRN97_06515 [Methanosarcinales archaeon]
MKIGTDHVTRALERLKAWVEVEEQRANFMAKDTTDHDEEVAYRAKAEVLEQVRIRISTTIMVIEEVSKEE